MECRNDDFDPGVTPRIDLRQQVSLCCRPTSFLEWTGFFCVWLRSHFQADQIQINKLKGLIWTPCSDTYTGTGEQAGPLTRIDIEPNTAWRPSLTEFRPAVVVKRMRWKQHREGIANRAAQPLPDGRQNYANYWDGVHTLFCLSADAGEAELLATEVKDEINNFSIEVTKAFRLFRFEVLEADEIAKLKGEKERFVVPITVGYTFEHAWSTKPDGPFFQMLQTAMTLVAAI